MKKLLSLVLAVMLIASVFVVPVSAATSEQTKLVNYLNGMVGQTSRKNSCQAFVYQSLNNCLGVKNTKTSCCATKAWQNYGVSTSRNNIPLGAAVYFGGPSITDSYCGQIAGHVGLYVGDNRIVHVWSSKVQKTTIDYVINCGYSYRGWGWQGGKALTNSIGEEKNPPTKPKINMTSYPTSIKKGSSYGLRGSVNANGASSEVRGYILDSKGKTVQSSKVQNTTSSSFDIRYSNVNNQLCFDKLSEGTYTLKITAKNKKGTANFEEKFTVTGKKPIINLTSYPSSIKKGSIYGLRGSINANGSSTEVRGYIINSKGKTVQSSTKQSTTSSSFNIRYSNVNNQLCFDKLSKGTYTLKITAKNLSGTTTVTKKFTVK